MASFPTVRIVSQDEREVKSFFEFLPEDLKDFYYNFPDPCWAAENTIAEWMEMSRRKVREKLEALVNIGLLNKQPFKNKGKRGNCRYRYTRTYPFLCTESIHNGVNPRYNLVPPSLDWYYSGDEIEHYYPDMNYSIFENYSPYELNSMDKIKLVELYMDAGFLVLPGHWVIQDSDGKFIRNNEGNLGCSCYKKFECRTIAKHPRLPAFKHINALTYADERDHILYQFKTQPKLNILFLVDGFGVIEYDHEHGYENWEKLKQQAIENGEHDYVVSLEHTLQVQSASGIHYYVKNTGLKNSVSELAPGVDTRGDRGIIVAPTSVHKSEWIYQFIQTGELGELPPSWVESLRTPVYQNRTRERKTLINPTNSERTVISLADIKLPSKLENQEPIPHGLRDGTLFKWAARLRGEGKSEERILETLKLIRDKYCVDPHEIPDSKLAYKARRIMEKPKWRDELMR